MKTRYLIAAVVLVFAAAAILFAAAPTTLNDFFLPGSQPGQSGNLEHPDKCDNCHGGYDQAVEPAFNWRGSMMSQAARDPLFYACLAIANQDAPESGDLCIRCHSPSGWLEGRSIPTDGSALNNNDREGVQCDFCHKLIKPTQLGVNPYPDDPDYVAGGTFDADQAYLATLTDIPPTSANGMYVTDANNAKRGPYVDAAARHKMYYSPFHKESAICGTCHDVSNPAYLRNADDTYSPNDFDAPAPDFDPYTMFPIERTYSEWLMSDYNTPNGVPSDVFGGNKANVSTCQDCHMYDVTGMGCNKKGAPVRDDLPMHDMTGGNTFIPELVKQLFPGEVNFAALDAGVQRATTMLTSAAKMDMTVAPQTTGYLATVKVTNETGHKLPSGYPEGRRIWINLKVYDASGALIKESGAYDNVTGVLTHDTEAKIYEIKPGLSEDVASILGLTAGPSFHFVVNNMIYFDNRIPPRGFTNANFEMIQSPPVGYSYADGQYWDETEYQIPEGAAQVVATLYYQTTTKEYVEFLRDENVTNDWGNVFYNLWNTNGKSAPVAMNTMTYDIAPINDQPPTADFAASPTSGTAPLTVNFTDLSSGSPTSWSWDFGDGGTSAEQNPVYTYNSAGVYAVSLTATNEFGSNTATKNDYITVQSATSTFMHVSNITITRQAAQGNREFALASITVVDQDDQPVGGATVTADYSGPTGGTVTGTTDASGVALLESRATKNTTGTWCFTVTDIAKTGAVYDPSANLVTTACETVAAKAAINPVTLYENHPNPFNPRTTISFMLPSAMNVRLEIFNIMGQRVATLADGYLGHGIHTFTWDASDAASGVYFYRLLAEDIVLTKKMLLTK